MTNLPTLSQALSDLITGLAAPEDKVGRTFAVDLLEEVNELERTDKIPAIKNHLKHRLQLRARILMLVYGERIESRKKAGNSSD